jgi:hypothetical protein
MTQEELNSYVNGCAFMGECFFEQTKDIEMPKESRRMIEFVFALSQSMFMREFIRRNANGLEIPKELKELIEKLDNDKDLN